MLKKIFILSILVVAFAGQFEFGYSESTTSRIFSLKNSDSFESAGLHVATLQEYLDTSAGVKTRIGFNAEKEINEKVDVFADMTFLDDSVLKIIKRLDIMSGVGVVVSDDNRNKHKVSYALVFRAGNLLHSFRHKYTCTAKLFDIKTTTTFISPDEEIHGDIKASFKVLKSLSFDLNHSFSIRGESRNYLSTAGFTIRY